MKKCKLCGKDLSAAIGLLGESAVTVMHQNAHIDEAIRGLLDAADQWPELEQYFEPLRKATAWRLEYDETDSEQARADALYVKTQREMIARMNAKWKDGKLR